MKSLVSLLLSFIVFNLVCQNKGLAQELVKPEVSVNSGFFYESFAVKISSGSEGSNIVYTLDGSDPKYSEDYAESASPVEITINPDNHDLRGATPGVVLRVVIRKNGTFVGGVTSRTYIFIKKVKDQGALGWTWPESKVNDQELDYAIDPNVVNDSRYKDKFEDALLEIPFFFFEEISSQLIPPSSVCNK
jgi:hypothetical protein